MEETSSRFDGPAFYGGLRRTGPEFFRSAEKRLPESSRRRAAAGMVALDEREHHQRGHRSRPAVDAPRGPGRLSELRCRAGNPAGGAEAPGLYDPGLERRIQA